MAHPDLKSSPEHYSRFFYGYVVVAVALFIMSLFWAIHYSFGIFFKHLINEFGWTRAMTSGAFSLCSIVHGLIAILMGDLTDKFGARIVITVSAFFVGLGCFLTSQVETLWHLYLFYGIIMGVGMGGSFVPLVSSVARWFIARRSLMTGIVAAGTGSGALIGPPCANRLIEMFGWRNSYAILACAVFVCVVLSAQFLRRDPAQVGQVALGQKPCKQKNLDKGISGISLRSAVYSDAFWLFFATGFCYGFCVFALMVHIAPHAIETGISPASAAKVLVTIGGLSIVGKILLGATADIIGSRRILIVGYVLMTSAFLFLVPARLASNLYLIASLFGFGYGGCTAAQPPLAAALFGLRSHGLIFGAFGVSVTIGAALGPLLTGYLFDVTASYQLAFLLCALISLSGMLLASLLKQTEVDCR
jgi:MFS family permease